MSKTKTETQDLQDQYWEVQDGDGQIKIIASRKAIYVLYLLFSSIPQHSCTQSTTKHHTMFN